MLDHVSIGVSDIQASKRFYDAVLLPLGYRCQYEHAAMLCYGAIESSLWLNATDRPVPRDEKSGLHFSFAAPNPASADAFHLAALRSGGTNNGPPGLRPDYGPGYYAAFVVDPDGYRIEAHHQAYSCYGAGHEQSLCHVVVPHRL
jgi:catechol 2,3-dioxygenase-like lactoylglutathione lyase family enzyme